MNKINIENISWFDKYKPLCYKNFKGFKKYKPIIESWYNSYKNTEKVLYPFLILVGPSAYGKTTLANCIFNELEYKIKEFNPTIVKNKLNLDKEIKTPKFSFECKSDGTFKKYGLLIDELDCLNLSENNITNMLRIIFLGETKILKNKEYKVRYPIICTANSLKNKKLNPIIKKSIIITIEEPDKNDLLNLGYEIVKNEKIPILKKELQYLLENINDYRTLIIKLYEIYIDIINIKTIKLKKEKIKQIIAKPLKKQLKINFKSINHILDDIIINFNHYDKEDILRFLDGNNKMSLMILLVNYHKFNNKYKIIYNIYDIINLLLNNVYYYDLLKYISYIIYYNLYLIRENISNNKISLKYYNQLNDMKQDKYYYMDHFNNNFNIVNTFNKKNKSYMFKNLKLNENNNDNILNEIIDIDLLYLYKNYETQTLGLNNTIFKKLLKCD